MAGATSNTGTFVMDDLINVTPAESIVALVRRKSDTTRLESLGVRVHRCDVADPLTYLRVIEPGSTFASIANPTVTNLIAPYLQRSGGRRSVHVTTTSIFSKYAPYAEKYRQIEKRLTSIPIPHAILRPTMIYGNNNDRNMSRLLKFLDKSPVFPVFGPGTALVQPVHVDDLADGIVAAIHGRVRGPFNLAGPEPMSYNDILKEASSALGRRVRLIHVDHRIAAALVNVFQRIPKFSVKHEQVMRLLEDEAFDIARSQAKLGFSLRPFRDGIRAEEASMSSQDR